MSGILFTLRVVSELSRLTGGAAMVCVTAAAAVLLLGCRENDVATESEAVRELIEGARRSFQANHDGDRREEAPLLYPRTPIGATEDEVREFLGDPTPGVSVADKWVYELGGKDTITLYFEAGVLKTKHWLISPVEPDAVFAIRTKELDTDPGSTAETTASDVQPSSPAKPDASAGPKVSTGTRRNDLPHD